MPLHLIAHLRWAGLVSLALVIATPASADTKAGYDLWNRGDFSGAVEAWRPLAIAGDPVAQYDLAQAYKLGRGVAQDLKMAQVWYGKAAAQGHVPSRDNYGLILFQNGDRAAAMPYIAEAAGRGEPRAQYVMGTALFNGDDVKQDWVRAYALMTRASAAGINAASLSLAQMDKYIPLDQRQQGLALARTFEVAAATAALDEIAAVANPIYNGPAANPALPPVYVPPPKPRTVAAQRPETGPKKPALGKQADVNGPSWRVQLAAFGGAAKANALWAGLHDRITALKPYRPFVVTSGAVTRLQAGPLASRAAANALCSAVKAAGQGCIPVGP